MTAAECVEDDEPHDRDTRAVLVNAQTVETEEAKQEHSANSRISTAQESSASSSYSVCFTLILAFIGLSGFFA